jgi:hypothetical protein
MCNVHSSEHYTGIIGWRKKEKSCEKTTPELRNFIFQIKKIYGKIGQ